MNKKELIEEIVNYIFLNYTKQKVQTWENCETGEKYPVTQNILDGKPRVFNLYENVEEIVNTYVKDVNVDIDEDVSAEIRQLEDIAQWNLVKGNKNDK